MISGCLTSSVLWRVAGNICLTPFVFELIPTPFIAKLSARTPALGDVTSLLRDSLINRLFFSGVTKSAKKERIHIASENILVHAFF